MVDTASEPPAESTVPATANTAAESSSTATPATAVSAYAAGDWQAIWSQPHNNYYYYNLITKETTWLNPVQQQAAPAEVGSPPSTSTSSLATGQSLGASEAGAAGVAAPSSSWNLYQLQAAAAAQGIDPSLAHLDPSLAAGPSSVAGSTFTAKFNARTGAFARADSRDPTHLSEYERAKRMSEFYFDVNEWEKDLEHRNSEEYKEEEEKKKKKKPTKKDLHRFREQKRLKKIAKTAWLRT